MYLTQLLSNEYFIKLVENGISDVVNNLDLTELTNC